MVMYLLKHIQLILFSIVRLLASECAFLACKNNLIEEEGLLLALRFLSQ